MPHMWSFFQNLVWLTTLAATFWMRSRQQHLWLFSSGAKCAGGFEGFSSLRESVLERAGGLLAWTTTYTLKLFSSLYSPSSHCHHSALFILHTHSGWSLKSLNQIMSLSCLNFLWFLFLLRLHFRMKFVRWGLHASFQHLKGQLRIGSILLAWPGLCICPYGQGTYDPLIAGFLE